MYFTFLSKLRLGSSNAGPAAMFLLLTHPLHHINFYDIILDSGSYERSFLPLKIFAVISRNRQTPGKICIHLRIGRIVLTKYIGGRKYRKRCKKVPISSQWFSHKAERLWLARRTYWIQVDDQASIHHIKVKLFVFHLDWLACLSPVPAWSRVDSGWILSAGDRRGQTARSSSVTTPSRPSVSLYLARHFYPPFTTFPLLSPAYCQYYIMRLWSFFETVTSHKVLWPGFAENYTEIHLVQICLDMKLIK